MALRWITNGTDILRSRTVAGLLSTFNVYYARNGWQWDGIFDLSDGTLTPVPLSDTHVDWSGNEVTMNNSAELKRHEENVGFEWRDAVAGNSLTVEECRQFNETGVFARHDVFSVEELVPVIKELDRFEAESTEQLRKNSNGEFFIARADEITFTPRLTGKSDVLKTFAAHEAIISLMADIIGPNVMMYNDQAVYKKPGTVHEFPWHQDNGYAFVVPQQYVTCWLALTDATLENGCPWVLPGVHLEGTLEHHWNGLGFDCLGHQPEEAIPDPVPVVLSAGSFAIFSSLTPHRTGPNETDGVRKAYILQYSADGAVVQRRGEPATAIEDIPFKYPILVDGERV